MFYIEQIITLLSLVMLLPAFISLLIIIKYFNSFGFKYSFKPKLFFFNTFIHSFLLAVTFINKQFYVAFITLSFAMFPAYFMLLLRKVHVKFRLNVRSNVEKEIQTKLGAKTRFISRLKRERVRQIAKSKWKS